MSGPNKLGVVAGYRNKGIPVTFIEQETGEAITTYAKIINRKELMDYSTSLSRLEKDRKAAEKAGDTEKLEGFSVSMLDKVEEFLLLVLGEETFQKFVSTKMTFGDQMGLFKSLMEVYSEVKEKKSSS